MVQNFSVHVAVWFFNELDVLITTANHNKEVQGQRDYDIARDPKGAEAIQQAVRQVEDLLNWGTNLQLLMNSGHVKNALDRLEHWKDDPKLWNDVFTRACALRDAVRIELGEYLFYAYPKVKGQKFSSWKPDWEKIGLAFPDVAIDSYCATDCYALGHNTASVFHSMRVAEIGLRALAKERRVSLPKNKPVEWGTWQEIIKALDDEIKLIGQTWKAGRRKDSALEFYSAARADLNGFKDEFRNLVMHVRVQYDEFQALRALTRVQEFMARLSGKLDHKHHRITWGKVS